MKVRMLKVALKNFRKIKSLEVEFGEVSYILGNNGTGKTTVLDGIWWLLFNKDSKGRKNFELKTLDKDGKQIHGLEHSVTLLLSIDGVKVEFKKVLKEKWTKKKGEAIKVFTGHETSYWINEIPVSQEGYKDKLSEIIGEEEFKEITNPTYFTSLHWTAQREKIGELVERVDNEEVIRSNPKLITLVEPLKNLDVDDYRKQLKVESNGYKDELFKIQPRIDECNNQIVEEDFKGLRITQQEHLHKLENFKNEQMGMKEFLIKKNRIETLLNMVKENLIKREAEQKKNSNLNLKTDKLNKIEQKICKLNLNKELERERISLSMKKEKDLKGSLEVYNEAQIILRKKWEEENLKKFLFSEQDKCCPTCNREYDEEILEKLKKDGEMDFEKQKDRRIEGINREGKNNKSYIKDIEEKLSKEQKFKGEIEGKLSSYEEELQGLNLEKEKLKEEIKGLEENGEGLKDNEELLERFNEYNIELNKIIENEPKDNTKEIKELEEDIRKCEIKLLKEERNNELNARIKELQEDERSLSENLARVEKIDFLCEEFIKTKVKIIEKRFNGKFKNITFKLFKELINGSIVECCECTSDGVPFSNLNTAAQINCGLEIIKALSEHYGISGPVFIDNRESINEIIDSDGQVINFMVTKDKKLVVQKHKEFMLADMDKEKSQRKLEF